MNSILMQSNSVRKISDFMGNREENFKANLNLKD
jgi:hypothetical protein